MAYDFQAAVNAAKAVVERQESAGSNTAYKFPLVYPQSGNTIVIRPLFNPASGQIVRLVNRHEKVPCYRTYGIECPICKVMQQVKDTTGQDPFGRTKSSKSRGIAFAQYISSTNQISKGENKGTLQPGEIILFMFPWSVYSAINTMIQAIAQTPTGMDQAFCHSQQGLFIQIQVTNDFKYTTTQVPYMTFPSQMSDDDFMKMLDGMESLNDQVIPAQITEEVDKQVKEYSDAIYRQYIAPRIPTQGVPAGTVPMNIGQQIPVQAPQGMPQNFSTPVPNTFVPGSTTPATVSAPPTPPSAATARPTCYGCHQQNNPQCICCPVEVNCMQDSASSASHPASDNIPF